MLACHSTERQAPRRNPIAALAIEVEGGSVATSALLGTESCRYAGKRAGNAEDRVGGIVGYSTRPPLPQCPPSDWRAEGRAEVPCSAPARELVGAAGWWSGRSTLSAGLGGSIASSP